MNSKFGFMLLLMVCMGASATVPCLAGRPGPVASAKFPCAAGLEEKPMAEPALSLNARTGTTSPRKAFMLSLLVPGLGQWYAGSPTRGKIFLAAEAAVWSSFAAFEVYSIWKKDDYRDFAVDHAGISTDGKDDDFFKRIGLYSDIATYNQEQLHARDMKNVYWDEDTYYWAWDTPKAQADYYELRESSRKAHRRALNMIGAAIVTRIVSAVDAVRTAKSVNRERANEEAGYKLGVTMKGSLKNPGAQIVLKKTF